MSSIFGKLLDFVAPEDGSSVEQTDVLASLVVTAPVDTPAAPAAPAKSSLDFTLEDIFKAGKVEGGHNSAETVLKMLDKLKTFPPEQQLAMVRAMETADGALDEVTVIADAQKRVGILARYGEFVDKEVQTFTQKEIDTYNGLKASSETRAAEIDAHIKALQDERDKLVTDTTAAKTAGEDRVKAFQTRAADAKMRSKGASDKYEMLVKFFGEKKA